MSRAGICALLAGVWLFAPAGCGVRLAPSDPSAPTAPATEPDTPAPVAPADAAPRPEFSSGSRRMRWKNTIVHLCYPAQLSAQSSWQISRTDADSIVDPLTTGKYTLPRPVKRILLDPGHGGENVGAVGRLYTEKELNANFASQLRDELSARGFEPLLSRDGDNFVSLEARGTQANTLEADIFLSLHCNAALKSDAQGVECYFLTPGGAVSTNGGEPAPALPANRFDGANANLACEIQSRLAAA